VRAVAKGVRRTSSKFGARLEPFMVADVQLYQGRSLDIVQQAESLGSYGADIVRTTTATPPRTRWSRPPTGSTTPRRPPAVPAARGRPAHAGRGEHAARSCSTRTCCARWRCRLGPSLTTARAAQPGAHVFVAQLGGVVCATARPSAARAFRPASGAARADRGRLGRVDAAPTATGRGIRPRRRLRPVASRARHPLPVAMESPLSPSPTRTAMRCRTARSTGPASTRRRSPRCRTTSRSSWTATAAGRTGAGSPASGHKAGEEVLLDVVAGAIQAG
jgi:DNA repair protein RecO (recombination protein O)